MIHRSILCAAAIPATLALAPGALGLSEYDTATKDTNVTIVGAGAGSSFGAALAAGDLTGDGVNDLVVSAPQLSTVNGGASGAVYVVEGGSGFPTEIRLKDTPAFATYIGPAANHELGTALLIEDVISPSGGAPDGAADLVIGTSFGTDLAGQVWIVAGPISADLSPRDIDDPVTGAVVDFSGVDAQDRLGSSLAVGDFDGDGQVDLAMGAPRARNLGQFQAGAVYVMKSPLGQGSFSVGDAADVTIMGGESLEAVGKALTTLDLSLGIPGADLAVGAPGLGTEDVGVVYLLDGGDGSTFFDGPGTIFELDQVAATVKIEGYGIGRAFGGGLASGDIDGDGLTDLCTVGASSFFGAIFVLRNTGAPWPAEISLDSSPPWLRFDDSGLNGAPDSIAVRLAVGQFHPEGHRDWGASEDLLIGTPARAGKRGGAFFMPGRSNFSGAPVSVADQSHTAIYGASGSERMGEAVAIADIDDDGRPDLIAGVSRGEDAELLRPGVVRVLLGGTPYSWAMSPAPGATNVLRNHDTVIRIYDEIMTGGVVGTLDEGVDRATIQFTVNDFPVPNELVEIRTPADEPGGDAQWKAEALVHWPEDSLGAGLNMSIVVEAHDEGGHPIVTEQWFYSIASDIESPFVVPGSTYPGALADTLGDVPLVTPIRARIEDNTAVRDSTVVMTVSFKRETELGGIYRDTVTVDLPDSSLTQINDRLVSIDYFTYADFFWTGLEPEDEPLRELFFPNDTVTVVLFAEDFVGNPLRDPRLFSFITIIDDEQPPYIAYPPIDGSTSPALAQTDVREDQRTEIQINDDGAGIRIRSWQWFCPACTTAAQAAEVLSDADKAELRPRILRIIPRSGDEPDTLNVSLDARFTDACGNGRTGYSGAPHCTKWTYFPNPQYRFNSEVRFLVTALDWAGNELVDEAYYFYTVEDLNPPFVVKTIPADGESAPTSVSVEVEIDDDISGLVDSTVVLSYETPAMGGYANIPLDDLEFQACDPPCNAGKRIVWIPEEAFPAGPVMMRVSATDKAENPMVPPYEWSFTASPDLIAPDIDITLLEQGRLVGDTTYTNPDSLGRSLCADIGSMVQEAVNVPKDSLLIVIEIEEPRLADTGIDLDEILVILNLSTAEQLLLVAAGDAAADAARVGTVTIDAEEDPEGVLRNVQISIRTDAISFGLGRRLSVEVEAADLEAGLPVPNWRSCNLFFTTTLSGLFNEPDPRIISPGLVDDKNDALVIQFPTGSARSNPFKVFNRRGELVAALSVDQNFSFETVVFSWDGRDAGGSLVPGGLYVYQYDAGNRVYSGTVGVAR